MADQPPMSPKTALGEYTLQKARIAAEKHNVNRRQKLKVTFASKNGECFSGMVYRISFNETEKKEDDLDNNFQVIAKRPPKNATNAINWNVYKYFEREKDAYSVLKMMEDYQVSRMVSMEQRFHAYPLMYDSFIKKERDEQKSDYYILFNDLRSPKNGGAFETFCRQEPLNADQCKRVLRELANFHAISFAMEIDTTFKEQFRNAYLNLDEITFGKTANGRLQDVAQSAMNEVMQGNGHEKLNHIRDKITEFVGNYIKNMKDLTKSERPVFVHGDCWISNFMFRHADESKNLENSEMRIIDWQSMRYSSVAIDLSYFLFCCTDSIVRAEMNHLLDIYHIQLTTRIAELRTSDAELFTRADLHKEMEKHGKFGVGMAMITLHGTTSEELGDVRAALEDANWDTNIIEDTRRLAQNEKYKKRMRDVLLDAHSLNYL